MISKRFYENLIANQNKIDERIEIKIKICLDENNVPEQIISRRFWIDKPKGRSFFSITLDAKAQNFTH